MNAEYGTHGACKATRNASIATACSVSVQPSVYAKDQDEIHNERRPGLQVLRVRVIERRADGHAPRAYTQDLSLCASRFVRQAGVDDPVETSWARQGGILPDVSADVVLKGSENILMHPTYVLRP